MSGNSSPNWNALIAKGRAKAIGVSWTEEEMELLVQKKVTPEELRIAQGYPADGFGRTPVKNSEMREQPKPEPKPEVKKEEPKEGKKPIQMTREELFQEAKNLGLEVSEELSRPELLSVVSEKIKGGIEPS